MTSQQNNDSIWTPFPADEGWLSGIRLIIPVSSGFYGMSGNQIAVTSNHQPTLAKLGKRVDMTALALDGGGFPLRIAVAFNLLKPPPSDFKIVQGGSVGENIQIFIPLSLSIAWVWHEGDERFGGIVKVVSDNYSDNDPLPAKNIPGLFVRLSAAMRLALAQLLLMVVPVAIINMSALIPVGLMVISCSLLLAIFWNQIPGDGWGKGLIMGLVCTGLTALLGVVHYYPVQPFILAGVFITASWLGGLFMGARSA